jgi:hypothetical protein
MIVYWDKGATPDEQAIADTLMAEKFDEVYVRVHTLDGKQGEMSIGLLARYIREALLQLQECEKQEVKEHRNAYSTAQSM